VQNEIREHRNSKATTWLRLTPENARPKHRREFQKLAQLLDAIESFFVHVDHHLVMIDDK
jgi:hypothetical protein